MASVGIKNSGFPFIFVPYHRPGLVWPNACGRKAHAYPKRSFGDGEPDRLGQAVEPRPIY